MSQNAAVSLLLACVLFSQAAHAADEPPSYPSLIIEDAKHVLSSPARWERDDWRDFGLASLAIVGTAALVDKPLHDEMRRHNGNNPTIKQIERFGAQYSLVLLGGFYVAGKATDDERAIQVAADGLAASIVASGIVTPTLKYAFGRSRPYENAGDFRFRPFSNANASFPSGHTTQAFAVASVIANHYEETWVTCASYSLAGLVGVSRSYHHAHYASDIVAGAMIGTLVGKSVVGYNERLRAGKVALMPVAAPGMAGVQLAGQF